MKDELYYAPTPAAFCGRALDLATGTGIWSIDFGDAHPAAVVIGTDLAPTQPTMVPPNVSFYIDDIESNWGYSPADAFDFIHARFLAGAVSDWPRLLRNCFATADCQAGLLVPSNADKAPSQLRKLSLAEGGGRDVRGWAKKRATEDWLD